MTMATTLRCMPQLWPDMRVFHEIPQDMQALLIQWSNKGLDIPPRPVVTLSSAGKVNIHDPDLVLSRLALQDASRAAVLALTYQTTHRAAYLNQSKAILLSWAKTYQPTGHPINETRLDRMIWAYDLIHCELSPVEKALILAWFRQLYLKKMNWPFGKVTTFNNHRIHQLKILLLLDRILKHGDLEQDDLKQTQFYLHKNLNDPSGRSVDYVQRHALYYHNYVLQAWLEIGLFMPCCDRSIELAFLFLMNKIKQHDIEHEFVNSEAQIDDARAQGGFEYATKGGCFDIKKVTPTILMYETLHKIKGDPVLDKFQSTHALSYELLFLKARRLLWSAHEH